MNARLTANFVKRFTAGPAIRMENLESCDSAGITVLFGASGSGKTTVLRCLAGLDHPDKGLIRFGSDVWFDDSCGFFWPPRLRNVGFVPQDYALFPHLTVEHNIGYGLGALLPAERSQRVAEMLEWIGLPGLQNRLPRELSGGQQQRVALARAVARRPQLLLLDEPLSALDGPTRLRLRGELRGLLRQLSIPTFLVTHDRQEALALGDHLVVLSEGRIVQQGPTHEVFSRPSSVAVADIVAVETIQPGQVLSCDDGLATVAVNGAKVNALAQELPEVTRDVFVCIRAEDVILVRSEDARSSARNRLPATIRALVYEGPLVRADLDCGFPLMALLTKQACEEMALREGERVMAMIKAPQIHLIPREANPSAR